MSPNRAALIGFVLALPMAILVSAIVFEIKPIENVLKSVLTSDGTQPNPLGFAYMIGSLLALPVALIANLWPVIRKGADGKRRLTIVNLLLAAVILAFMAPTWGGLAQDIYRCDILHIPNCD